MSSAFITPAMQEAIKGPQRTLCWLFWAETTTGDFYAWSGGQPITWDGHTFVGVSGLLGMSSQRKPDALQHVEQTFTLSGLEADLLNGLDESVRGLQAKLWLGALDRAGQIIRDPLLVSDMVQDTMKLEASGEGTVSITLTCYEALPFLGRVRGDKYSHEAWLQRYADTGFYYNDRNPAERMPDWRP